MSVPVAAGGCGGVFDATAFVDAAVASKTLPQPPRRGSDEATRRGMEICHEESGPRCLVYREPPRPWLGAAITTLGPLVGLAAAAIVATRDVDGLSLFAALMGFIALVSLPVIGTGMMCDYRILLDKEDRQIVKSWRFFSRSSTTRQPLGTPTRVGWTVEATSHSTGMGSTRSYSYPVKLSYERGGHPLDASRRHPFRTPFLLASGGYPSQKLVTAKSMEEARRLTRDVAEFLGIDQGHWDDDHPFLARFHADRA